MSNRDIDRIERIIVPHMDDAYTLAHYLVRDEHDAQDVVQDAVLRALRYFDGYREGDARAWLLAIVRNCCHTYYRRNRADRLAVSYSDADTEPQLRDRAEADARARSASRTHPQRDRATRRLHRCDAPSRAARHAGADRGRGNRRRPGLPRLVRGRTPDAVDGAGRAAGVSQPHPVADARTSDG